MEKQYQQLQPEERLTIASMHLRGSSMRAMARMLGRSPATVSRELASHCLCAGRLSWPWSRAEIALGVDTSRTVRHHATRIQWRSLRAA